jgi:hypothetical protein
MIDQNKQNTYDNAENIGIAFLENFVDQLLSDPFFTSMPDEMKADLKSKIIATLNERINKVAVSKLSSEDTKKLESFIDGPQPIDCEQIGLFFQEKIPFLDQLISAELQNFKKEFFAAFKGGSDSSKKKEQPSEMGQKKKKSIINFLVAHPKFGYVINGIFLISSLVWCWVYYFRGNSSIEPQKNIAPVKTENVSKPQIKISLEEAQKEVAALRSKIKNANDAMKQEVDRIFKELEGEYISSRQKLENTPVPPKDMFESTLQYETRLKQHKDELTLLEMRYNRKQKEAKSLLAEGLSKKTKDWNDRINELSEKTFSASILSVSLMTYDAEQQCFIIKIGNENCYLFMDPVKAKALYANKSFSAEGKYKFTEEGKSRVFTEATLINKVTGDRYPIIPFGGVSLNGKPGRVYNASVKDVDNYFIKNEDGTVTDAITGLKWKIVSTTSMPLKEAALKMGDLVREEIRKGSKQKEYKMDIEWGIPTVEQLSSLISKTPYPSSSATGHVFLNTHFFPFIMPFRRPIFWTVDMAPDKVEKSILLGKSTYHMFWCVGFHDGSVGVLPEENSAYYLLVQEMK